MKGALGRVRPLHIALFVGLLTSAYTYLGYYRTDLFYDSFLQKLELRLLDSKFLIRGRVDIDPGVVIAAGDEKAIDVLGLWGTWDRAAIARVIEVLIEAKADVVAFDMVFADEVGIDHRNTARLRALLESEGLVELLQDGAIPAGAAQRLRDFAEVLVEAMSGDEKLAGALEEHSSRVVQGFIVNRWPEPGYPPADPETTLEKIDTFVLREYGYGYRVEDQGEAAKAAGAESRIAVLVPHEGGRPSDLSSVREAIGEVILPRDAFLEAAEYIGFFSIEPDPDGTMRRVPMIYRHGEAFLPSLALTTAALHYGGSPMLFAHSAVPGALSYIGLPLEGGEVVRIPTEHDGTLLINYYGPSEPRRPDGTGGVFPRVSLADLYCYQNEACPEKMRSAFDPKSVQGKVVIVAVTALGTFDQRVTPFSPMVPGVEVHAAAVQNLLRGDALSRDDLQCQIELALSIVLALLLGFGLQRLRILWGTQLAIGVFGAWWALDTFVLFARGHMWFHQLPLFLQTAVTWSGITLWGYLSEGREKALLKKEFSTVLAPAVVEELLKNPELAGLGGDERDLTVLFSDIRGFTSISEGLSPEGLTSFLNEYLTPMTEVLMKHQGTLDKYMGDAIMAFWGAPIAQPDHATRACLAALDMLDELLRLKEKWRAEGKPDIDIGIGLNSGLMRVGFMGSERMRNYTLLGDNVNLGSRLEGVNKQYGTNIIISQYTYEKAKGAVYARELDAIRVKGKREPVTIYELRGRGEPKEGERAFIEAFHEGLALYKGRRFAEALECFQKLAAEHPNDPPSRVYIERCVQFIEQPPPEGWDGVFEMKTK